MVGSGSRTTADARPLRQRARPQLEIAGLAGADAGVIARLPGFERRDRADDAFLADLHAAADAAVLQVGGADQRRAPRDDAAGRAAEELVRRVERDIAAPCARKPFRSYSEAASTMTGTPRAWQIAANSLSGICPYCTVWWETT